MAGPRTPLAVVLLAGLAAAGDGVAWHSSLEDAQEAAAVSGKPVLALFWAEW